MKYLDHRVSRSLSREFPRVLERSGENPSTDWSTFNWDTIDDDFDWSVVDLTAVDWSKVPWRKIDFSDGKVTGRDVDWNLLDMDTDPGPKVPIRALDTSGVSPELLKGDYLEQHQHAIKLLGNLADINY